MISKLVLLILVVIATKGELFAQGQSTNGTKTSPKDTLVKDVSVIQLIAMADIYQGQFVRTVGYLVRQYEHSTLYLHKEDYDHNIKKNGLWAGFSAQVAKGKNVTSYLRPYNGKYVVIVGTFDRAKGHLDMFSGTIREITHIDTVGYNK